VIEAQTKKAIYSAVREWVKGEVEGEDHVDLARLADEAVDYFMRDEEILRNCLRIVLRPLVYEVARLVLRSTRGEEVIDLGPDEIVTRGEHTRRGKTLSQKFAKWMEHSGDNGHMRMVKMTKPQLLIAAQERKRRGHTELKIAAFQERLAAGMKSGEVVEQRYTIEDMRRIWSEVEATGGL
jgi:hypothetical protein